MMDAKVTWQGRMSFTGSANTGFKVPLGTTPEVGGDNDGFQPMELLATSLAGCTAMDVVSILQKKRQDLKAFDVQVHARRATEHPKVITQATIEFTVSGHNIDEAAVLRSIELSATRYCPALAMFSKIFPIQMEYAIYEDLGGGGRKLVKRGAYVPSPDLVTPG
jgi:putative redox protein